MLSQLASHSLGYSQRELADSDRITPLHWFARCGNVQAVRSLLRQATHATEEKGAPNTGQQQQPQPQQSQHDCGDETTGTIASRKEDGSLVQDSLSELVNAATKAGNVPLHWAAMNGHTETVRVLIEEGHALIDIRNRLV